MPIDINSLNGIQKDIALLITDNKNETSLNGNKESIFTEVNNAVTDLLDDKDLTFSKIYQSIYKIATAVKDFFNNNLIKMVKFCKNIASKILEKFKEIVSHRGDRGDLVNAAQGYIGTVDNRKVGNILFSNGRDEEWCADTVTTIVKDIVGDKIPKDFGSASVSGIMEWGKKHKSYTDTASMSLEARRKYILNNVKPGDIMIEKRNKSHTGIVTRVYEKDGEVWFDTIEGNMGSRNAQDRRLGAKSYPATSATLSGFVKLDKWLD